MTRTRLVLSKGDDLLGPPRRAESARARALVLSKGGDPLGPPRRAKSTRARALVAMAVAALFVLSGCSLAQLGTRPRPEAVPPVAAVTPPPGATVVEVGYTMGGGFSTFTCRVAG